MPYVKRDETGNIVSIFSSPNDKATEYAENPIIHSDTNIGILEKLVAIDMKSVRALREGDQDRIDALESEAEELRVQLV